MHKPRRSYAAVHPHAIAVAAALLLAAAAPSQAQYYDYDPAGAVSTWPTNVFPIDVFSAALDLRPNQLLVGFGAAGSFSAFAGADLQAAGLLIGGSGTGTGTFAVEGNYESNTGALVRLGGLGGRLSVGEWGTGSLTVSQGAVVDASIDTAGCAANSCRSFVGNGAGSTGTLTITGTGSELRTARSFTVGQTSVFTDPGSEFGTPGGTTNAFVNVQAGGTLRTELGTVAQNNASPNGVGTEKANGTVTVDGAGSKWVVTRASIDNTVAALTIGRFAGADGLVTISGGGLLQIDGTGSPGPNDGINIGRSGGSGALIVTGIGSTVQAVGNNGFINVGGNAEGPSNGSFQLLAGATASTLYVNVGGSNGGIGTITIDGIGSTLTQSGVGTNQSPGSNGPAFAHIGRNSGGGASTGTVVISNGGQWLIGDGGGDGRASQSSPGIALGRGADSQGTLIITGAGSKVEVVSSSQNPGVGVGDNYNPFFAVGYDNPTTSSGTLTINDGGKLILTGNAVATTDHPRATQLAIGGRSGVAGTGSATVAGANSEVVVQGQDPLITVGRTAGGSGILNVLNGGKVSSTLLLIGTESTGIVNVDNAQIALAGHFNEVGVGAGLGVGRGGGTGILNLSNAATLSIDPDTFAGGGMGIGGTALAPGGTGTVTLSSGSAITMGGSTAAGISIGPNGTGTLILSGASTVDAGTNNVDIGRTTTGSGTLAVASASKFDAGQIDIGGNSDSVAGGFGAATILGAGSELNAVGAIGFVGVGRGGTGTLTVSDQAKVSAIVLNVGRSGGQGMLLVDNASLELAGQQTAGLLSGAGVVVGKSGGNGTAIVQNGSRVNISNAGSAGAYVTIGGSGNFPGGTGRLDLTGGSELRLSAAPGLARVNVGRDGRGEALIDGGSLIDVGDGGVYVARFAGSEDSSLTVSGGSTITAGFVGVGVSAPGTGASLGAAGGTGTLTLNNSTIIASRFELGAGSTLAGDGGTIQIEPSNGYVVIGGTIAPGNSPGRLRIRCNIVMLGGSRIVLEISGSGNSLADYEFDELIIDDLSTFDLKSAQIEFSFLDNTNPNTVSALGGLNLDYYLRTMASTETSIDGPTQSLATVFAENETWGDVVNMATITAVSTDPDYKNIIITGFNPDGTLQVSATPEPSTWGLMFVGLAAVGAFARRRRASMATA